MMYLVLTAMLAMNVSADLLNAFSLVDSGLSQTVRNYAGKNKKTFSQFAEAETLNPRKVGPWRMKAEQIHNMAHEINDYVNELKIKLVTLTEGENSPAIGENGEVDGNLVESKSNTDIPAQVMILEGGGKHIRELLEKFRETALGMLNKERDEQLYAAIEGMLETNAPPATDDGIQHTWESYRFEHIPLIAVLPQLTKVQVDALNAEADMMAHLLNRIDAGDFKFNQISAVVIPNSDYITQGEKFRAEIFLAASDTTQRPKVFIGAYDSIRNPETGEWDYKMRAGHEKDTIPVTGAGKGIYERVAGSVGTISWGGLIEIQGPENSIIRKPFRHRYTVAASSMAVSPLKMNLMYIGVDNPMSVSVAGLQASQFRVGLTGGSLRNGPNGTYIVRPHRGAKFCDVVVTTTDGKRVGSQRFRAKEVPAPQPALIGIEGRRVGKGQLLKCAGLSAKPEDFDFAATYSVLSFKLEATAGGGVWLDAQSNGARFSDKQLGIIRQQKPGSRVLISDIKVKYPSGEVKTLKQGLSVQLK